MYIREIAIRNFRHLENVNLGPFGQPSEQSDLVVLAGPNGGGKSSVLELIGFALTNTWGWSWQVSRSFPQSSFEIALAITPTERELIVEYAESQPPVKSSYERVLDYLEHDLTYYRSFNYEGGRYEQNSTLHNQIASLVSQALRDQYGRQIGFFLRSDRYYSDREFDRRQLFDYPQIASRGYKWTLAFNLSEIQYRDMFDFLVQQRYHYFRTLGVHHHRLQGGDETGDVPTDPLLPYDGLLQRLFPGYRFANTDEEIPSNLFVEISSGEVIKFSDLSSGEKEVFFVLASFLRHNVTNAVIMVDEPELHLHPELARVLVRTMQDVTLGNQIWLATHNTEVIDEAGRDRVTYLARDPETRRAVATHGTDEAETIRQVRDLFGYSGYIGVARSMVFLEGLDASSDRKMFSRLFADQASRVKFVPSRSSAEMLRINAAVLSILESNLGWIQFYLVRDRDFLPPEVVRAYRERSAGRLYVLDRHEIENYLLEDELIARVQTDTFGIPTSAERVRDRLRTVALAISGQTLHNMVAFRLNLRYRPEDFSLGREFANRPVIDASGNWSNETVEDLRDRMIGRASEVVRIVTDSLNAAEVEEVLASCQQKIGEAIRPDSNGWRSLFPGKQLLGDYARAEQLRDPIVLQNSVIKEMAATPDRIPSELRRVMQVISAGELFAVDGEP